MGNRSGRRTKSLVAITTYEDDTPIIMAKGDMVPTTLPGNQTHARKAFDLNTGTEIELELPSIKPEDYKRQLMRGVTSNPLYQWAFNLIHMPHGTTWFSRHLVKRFGHDIGLFSPLGIREADLDDILEDKGLTDEHVEELVEVTLAHMNQDKVRVKDEETVRKWYKGTTLIASEANMRYLAEKDDDLGHFAQAFIEHDEQCLIRQAFYRLGLVTRYINRKVNGRNHRETTMPSTSCSSGNRLNPAKDLQQLIDDVDSRIRKDTTFIVTRRVRSVTPVKKMPAHSHRYTTTNRGSVDLATLIGHREVLQVAIEEAFYHWAHDVLVKQGISFTSGEEVVVPHYGCLLLNKYVLRYGKYVNTYRAVFEDSPLHASTNNAADENIAGQLTHVLQQLLEPLHVAVYRGDIDTHLQQLGVHVPRRTVDTAIQNYLKITSNLPRRYLEYMRLWQQAFVVPNTSYKECIEKLGKVEKQLEHEYGLLGKHEMLVSTRLVENRSRPYLFQHQSASSDVETFHRLRRYVLVTGENITFLSKDKTRKILSLYGVPGLLASIPQPNFEELPAWQHALFSKVTLRLPALDRSITLDFDPQVFPDGIPLIWFGLEGGLLSNQRPNGYGVAVYAHGASKIVLVPPEEFAMRYSTRPGWQTKIAYKSLEKHSLINDPC